MIKKIVKYKFLKEKHQLNDYNIIMKSKASNEDKRLDRSVNFDYRLKK